MAPRGPEAGFGSMSSSHYLMHCKEPQALSLQPNSPCSGHLYSLGSGQVLHSNLGHHKPWLCPFTGALLSPGVACHSALTQPVTMLCSPKASNPPAHPTPEKLEANLEIEEEAREENMAVRTSLKVP